MLGSELWGPMAQREQYRSWEVRRVRKEQWARLGTWHSSGAGGDRAQSNGGKTFCRVACCKRVQRKVQCKRAALSMQKGASSAYCVGGKCSQSCDFVRVGEFVGSHDYTNDLHAHQSYNWCTYEMAKIHDQRHHSFDEGITNYVDTSLQYKLQYRYLKRDVKMAQAYVHRNCCDEPLEKRNDRFLDFVARLQLVDGFLLQYQRWQEDLFALDCA
jgi:hypothetical protein